MKFNQIVLVSHFPSANTIAAHSVFTSHDVNEMNRNPGTRTAHTHTNGSNGKHMKRWNGKGYRCAIACAGLSQHSTVNILMSSSLRFQFHSFRLSLVHPDDSESM